MKAAFIIHGSSQARTNWLRYIVQIISELFSDGIRQTLVVTESFYRFPVLHPNVCSHIILHLLELFCGEIGFVVFPAWPILAYVFCSSINFLLDKAADINPGIFVAEVVVVVEEVLRNHVLLQALLGELAFEEQPPH